MKFLKKFLKDLLSPIGIAITIMHHIVVAFSLSFENTQIFSNSYTFGLPEPTLYPWLIYLNIPSLFIIEFIVHPVLSLFGRNLLTESLGVLILICIVTFQWFLVGYAVTEIYNFIKPKESNLSLN